jgi:hypothetical protein
MHAFFYSLLIVFLLVLQMDRRTGKPKIWMYKDKITGKPKGEATVTYDDANAARSAIDWFDGVLCCVTLFAILYTSVKLEGNMLNVSVTFQEKTLKDPLLKYRWHSIRTIILVDVEDVGVDVVVVVVVVVVAAAAAAWIEEAVEEEGTVFVSRVVEVKSKLDAVLLTVILPLKSMYIVSSPNLLCTVKFWHC